MKKANSGINDINDSVLRQKIFQNCSTVAVAHIGEIPYPSIGISDTSRCY